MKLGPLKTAIRQHSGSVEVYANLLDGWFAVQKGSFIEALDRRFGTNGVETGMRLDENGRIQADEGAGTLL